MLGERHRVDVRRVRGERQAGTGLPRVRVELPEQLRRPADAAGLQHVIERVEPFTGLGGFDSGHIALAAGSGEPAMFYGSINLLGNLKITEIRGSAP